MSDLTKKKMQDKFADQIISVSENFAELAFEIKKDSLLDIITFLNEDSELQYLHLSDVTATDWPQAKQRHRLVYHLYSYDLAEYVRLIVKLAEDETIASLTCRWDCADWLEREVYDMFGVIFEGHPDLSRILLWEDFEGHPLRKDYPLTYEIPQFSYNKNEPPEVIK